MTTALILVCIGLFILMVISFILRNRREEHRDFMAGVKRGLEDYRAGRVKPWSEVKKSLGKGKDEKDAD